MSRDLATAARARHEAMRQYARAHDGWAEREQLLLLGGHVVDARGAREMAHIAVRAWLAEQQDPIPEGLTP